VNEFVIDNIERLRWLLLVIGCGAVVVYGFAMKQRALRAFASANLLGFLVPDLSRPRQIIKAILLLAAMVAIVLALVGPRYGSFWTDVQQRQLDLVICLDVSNSMLAEDAGMSRLGRAKDDIKRLVDQLHGGMVGLVAFAGRAAVVCPLTDDYDFYRLALDDVGPFTVPLGGTNLGEAIASAVKAFGDQKREQRVILVMSDGEDHGDTAVKEAAKARELKILVYAIGIGDDQRGALIPIEKDGQRTYLKYNDQQLWSKMDPAMLRAIADAGGGEYHPSGQVTPTQRTLEWIYSEKLVPMEKRAMEKRQVRQQFARFHWPATLALVLLMLETLMSERRRTDDRKDRKPQQGPAPAGSGAGVR
jgi:Ca-activated chloride channel family protein